MKLRINITWELDCDPEDYEQEMIKFDLPPFIEYPIPEDYEVENLDDYDLVEELSDNYGFLISDLQVVVVND